MSTLVYWAFFSGGIAAFSLTLGSLVGLTVRIPSYIIGILAAFGAGALLSALAIELVAPTVEHLVTAETPQEINESKHSFFVLIGGCIVGGVLFVILDQLIGQGGGYLRKTAYIISKSAIKKEKFFRETLEDICNIPMFASVSPEDIEAILVRLKPRLYNDGDKVFSRGDTAQAMFIVHYGKLAVDSPDHRDIELEKGSIVGEMALLNNTKRPSDVRALEKTELLVLSADDFHDLRKMIPEFDEAVKKLATERHKENIAFLEQDSLERKNWTNQAMKAISLGTGQQLPTRTDLQKDHDSHSHAAMAIWLGIALDAIPESFVIGIAIFGTAAAQAANGIEPTFLSVLPYTFIAGLFLSNFPEALSSSAQMQKQGMSFTRVLSLWSSLVILTAVGAALGAYIGDSISHGSLVFIEGIAAGAMLTMICSAMLPEASHLSDNNLVGLSTLGGFLCSIMFKLLE